MIGWLSLFAATSITLFALRGRKRRVLVPADDLESWEKAGPDVGVDGEPIESDAPPVGSGSPDDYCAPSMGLLASSSSCPSDPLSLPEFVPVDRGAPFAASSPGALWPTITKDSQRLVVSYWSGSGPRGSSGRAFGAARESDDGVQRHHAGVDLFANDQDPVVAPVDGRILWIGPFFRGTWAVYLRAGDLVINLGEVSDLSWRDFSLPEPVQLPGERKPSARIRPGVQVRAGQKLARVGAQEEGGAVGEVDPLQRDRWPRPASRIPRGVVVALSLR